MSDEKIERLIDQMQAVEIALAGLSAEELAALWRRLKQREREGQQGAQPRLRLVPPAGMEAVLADEKGGQE